MKHSNLYLGLVLPSGGWQSLINGIFLIEYGEVNLNGKNGTC